MRRFYRPMQHGTRVDLSIGDLLIFTQILVFQLGINRLLPLRVGRDMREKCAWETEVSDCLWRGEPVAI